MFVYVYRELNLETNKRKWLLPRRNLFNRFQGDRAMIRRLRSCNFARQEEWSSPAISLFSLLLLLIGEDK